ncbi:DUF445 family protein [Clostridium scatologenes]|uniref:DUF445 family protein n=1 Tax=Clostridium scatologenes TaxID=1548 RepID=A0A0E3JNC8_CLOSL|nr:DUF445 family protein [Clostridium scatologenes]AKA69079.1 hypothetical protein CSCA_1954 [Clostridium scatologenes]
MEFNLIKEILTGSITGYITNALAIKMIFREYGIGKFKVGGMVVRTRNEFIDNVSSLVENDIINFHTLKGELEKDSFKQSIKGFSNDLLKNKIYKNTLNLSLCEIKGFNSTMDKTESYIREHVDENFSNIFEGVCRNVSLKDVLNDKQLESISENVFRYSVNKLNTDDFIEKAIVDFYNENKFLSIEEFLGSKIVECLSESFEDNFSNFNMDLKNNFSTSIDSSFENTIEILKVDEVLNKLQEKISQKTIVDFVKSEDINNFCKCLSCKIEEFLKGNKGKKLIDNFIVELFTVVKSMDKSIYDLLSENAEENIEIFIKDKLQYGVKELILWIQNNKNDIEGLVENALDDTINAIDDDMKKGTLSSLKDKFLSGSASRFGMVSKITEYLDDNVDIDSVSSEITDKIIRYVKEQKLSNVIEMLRENNVFSGETIENFISCSFSNYLNESLQAYVLEISNKKIGDICTLDLVGIFKTYIKKPLLSTIKNKYIYSDNITKLVKNEVIKGLNNINVLKISELINEQTIHENSNSIKKSIVEKLNDNKGYVINLIYKQLASSIGDGNLYNSLNENERKNILNEVVDNILLKANDAIDNLKQVEVKKLCDGINKIENVDGILSNNIELWLNDNLEYVVKGNIKETISKNLSKLKDEELKVAVEEFMGKEMKPITVIGALLGAIAGIGMYFYDKSTAGYSFLTVTIINLIVYGFVGWITNVQAIAMLFRPYTEKRIFGMKIPFTPGVVAARKPKFAKSMSAFVDNSLLDKDSMKYLFNKNQDTIYKKLEERVSENDYKIAVEVLNKYSDTINNISYNYIKEIINKNKEKISNSLARELSNFTPSTGSFSHIEEKIVKEALEKIKESHKVISNSLEEFLKSEKSISEAIPDNFKTSLQNKLNYKVEEELNNLSSYFNEENNFVNHFQGEYDGIVNKPVNEAIDSKYIIKWNEFFDGLIKDKLSSKETEDKVLNFIEAVISKEISSDKKISELFNGLFVKMLGYKFNFIVEGIIGYASKKLTDNEQIIAESASATIEEGLGFFEKLGYSMLGGDAIVADVVSNVINKQFPHFIEDKKVELYQVIANFAGDKVLGSTVSDININIESKEVFNIVSSEECMGVVQSNLMRTSNEMFNSLTEIKIESYLKDISISSIKDLCRVFEEEIKFIDKEMANSINEHKNLIVNEYSNLGYRVFEDLILSRKISDFTGKIETEYVEDIAKNLTNLAFSSSSVQQNLQSFIEVLANSVITEKGINEFFDLKEFNNSILCVIEKLIEDEEIDEELKKSIAHIIEDITKNNLNIVDSDTKKDILSIIIKSGIDAAEDNFSNVIDSIDFRGITEKQINKMNAKEIEDLFNSFAKKYFNRLKLYGFGGAFFGLHWAIGVIAFVIYKASELKDKLKG